MQRLFMRTMNIEENIGSFCLKKLSKLENNMVLVREALQNYENSVIVKNNEEAIYDIIKEIIKNNKESFFDKKEKYDNSKIITRLEKLLEEEVKTIDI